MSAGVVDQDELMNNKAEGQEPIKANNGGEEPIKNEAVDRQLSAGGEETPLPAEVEANGIQSDSEEEKELFLPNNADKFEGGVQDEVIQQSESISETQFEQEQVDGVREPGEVVKEQGAKTPEALPVGMAEECEDDACVVIETAVMETSPTQGDATSGTRDVIVDDIEIDLDPCAVDKDKNGLEGPSNQTGSTVGDVRETLMEHETNERQLSSETREISMVDLERSGSELAVVDMSFAQPLVPQLSEAVPVGMIVENNDDHSGVEHHVDC